MSTVLNDALRLAAMGRPVFPCKSVAHGKELHKTPHTINGFKNAVTDPDCIREWWRQYPDALVGVPTGEASGLFVIDVDSGRHDEANDWLERYWPYLPDTRQHATYSSGWHLLFRHRAELRSGASRLAKGVDTRGEGGYIIWWPFHVGLNAPHKLDRSLCDLPDELYQQLTQPEPRPAPPPCRPRLHGQRTERISGLLSHLQRAREGERNSMLFWCANRVCDMAKIGEMGRGEVAQALQSLAGAAHQTGLSIKEIERTINSATTGTQR